MRKAGLIVVALTAAMFGGCGGGDPADDAFVGGGGCNCGTGGGTTTTAAQLGSGTGATFQPGAIDISSASVSAGGSTSLAVSAVKTDGTLFTDETIVTFNSPCIAAGTASVTPAAVTTTTGNATATYVAKGCVGTDIVTATATIAGVNRSATGTLTVAQAAIGSITFVSATPTNIALKGTSAAGRPESSTVVFKVLDAAGGPRQGATVTFALNTTVGGITLTPSTATATSDAQGQVQVIVNAGTVAAAVRVTATIASPAISTQSSQLTITTGIASSDSMSLAAACHSLEGWDIDGTTTDITVRLADRFNNPVPDGTAVTFTSEGGTIGAQCTTTTNANEGGVCKVVLRSSNPRPADGRVTLLAKAIGEESFVDRNGNGAFDTGDTYTDIPEPYRDDNENSAYNIGEDFFDFNSNGIRDPADGFFNGVCATGTAACAGGSRSVGLGRQLTLVMSGSSAQISGVDGNPVADYTFPVGVAAHDFAFWVRDNRDNLLPGGTKVEAEIGGSGGAQIIGISSYTIGCAAAPSQGALVPNFTVFIFRVTPGTTPGATSFLNVKATVPSGVVTQAPGVLISQ